jgi:hypothetical protein
MKKLFALFVILALTAPVASAAQRGTPEYEKLKAYKQKQLQEKEACKADPSKKAKGFWEKEAERSGLAGTGAMLSNAVSNAVPSGKSKSE